jgi:hypothetical protein
MENHTIQMNEFVLMNDVIEQDSNEDSIMQAVTRPFGCLYVMMLN